MRSNALWSTLLCAACAVPNSQRDTTSVEIVQRWEAGALDDDHDFAACIEAIGDVNGDGCIDVLVGSPSRRIAGVPGEVELLSGRDGTLLRRIVGTDELYGDPPIHKHGSHGFGVVVCALPDVNGDHVADFAVADPGIVWPNTQPPCAIWIFSGADGRVVHRFRKDNVEQLGLELVAAGDLDGDGICDLWALGGEGRPEYLEAFSLRRGTQLYRSELSPTARGFVARWVLLKTGDLDADGKDDSVAGYFNNAGEQAELQLLSGATGSISAKLTSRELLRIARESNQVRVIGDVDGDGVQDVVLNADDDPGDSRDSDLVVRSGADGRELARRTCDEIGSVQLLGDIDRDGSCVVAVDQLGDVVRAFTIRGVRSKAPRVR